MNKGAPIDALASLHPANIIKKNEKDFETIQERGRNQHFTIKEIELDLES
jgi:hypothetical protein